MSGVRKFVGNNVATLGLLTLGSLVVALTGCQSLNVDESPSTVRVEGLGLSERVDLQNKLKMRLASPEAILNVAKEVTENFKRIESPTAGQDVYTPIDFLIDLNDIATNTLPKATKDVDGSYSHGGLIKLPKILATPTCSEMHARVSYITDQQGQIAELSYSLSSCETPDRFVVVANLLWVEDQIEINISKDGIRDVFGDLLDAHLKDQLKCVGRVEGRQLVSFDCNDLLIRVSASEEVHIKELHFARGAATKVSVISEILENSNLKARANLTISSQGKAHFDMEKVAIQPIGLE